jgi:aryl-alcohol dehydrogenase-like predicted oxidoreductase
MNYRRLGNTSLSVSTIALGTWAFGGDAWWGSQNDSDSVAVLEYTLKEGLNLIDTAPIYGRGRAEKLIGSFLRKRNLRRKVILATKLGLNWEGSKVWRNLSRKRMQEELDASRKRLETDYFDLYQVHWPDPDTPIAETAGTMYSFYRKGLIAAIGVSNYSLAQIEEFLKYSPLHSVQPEYSLFQREIESDIVPFCLRHNISILSYAPLYSGLLTGKFFLDSTPVPSDINRKMKRKHLSEPLFSLNKETLARLKSIALSCGKTLTHLAISWNFSQKGITSTIVGMRNLKQAKENLGALDCNLSEADMQEIGRILNARREKAKTLT